MDFAGIAAALGRFDARSAERGRRYARDGHVRRLDVDRQGRGFGASVRGASAYRCEWVRRGQRWSNACNCPLGGQCKHAYAAACALLACTLSATGIVRTAEPARFELPPRLGAVPLPPLRVVELSLMVGEETSGDRAVEFGEGDFDLDAAFAAAAADPDASRALPTSLQHDGSPVSGRASSHRRPVRPDAVELLAALRSARSRHDRYSYIYDICRRFSLSGERVLATDLALEDDGEVRCALLVARLSRLVAQPLPPELDAFRTSPSAVEKLRVRCERQLRAQVEEWVAPAATRYEKHLRVTIGIAHGVSGELYFELFPLLTSKRLRDDRRRPEQLRSLLEETRQRPDVLAPQSRALLEWLCTFFLSASWWAREEIRGADLERLLLGFGHTGLITWEASEDAEMLARGGVEAGQPAVMARESAAIEPDCIVDGDSARLQVRVRLGCDRTCSLDEILYIQPREERGGPSYAVAAGAIWRVVSAPPVGVVEGFRVLRSLELEPDERVPVLRQLAPANPSLTATLEQHTARVPCRAVFLLDGDPEELLRIRLLAVPRELNWQPGAAPAESDQLLFEYGTGGTWIRGAGSTSRPLQSDLSVQLREHEMQPDWSPMGGTLPSATEATDCPAGDAIAAASAWLVEPDRESSEPAAAWLRALCPDASAFDGHAWRTPIGPSRLEALVRAWDERPPAAAFFATRRVQRLLREPSPTPKLDIRASGKDWFAIKVDWQLEGESLTAADVAAMLSGSGTFVRLRGGWIRAAAGEKMRATFEALAEVGIDVGGDEQRVGLWQLAAAPPQALAHLERLGADPQTVAAAQELRRKVAAFGGLPRVPVPRTFRGELRAYQRDGLDFLAFTSSLGSGAVLADDMGLGKTVQTLAWLEGLRLSRKLEGPVLVVCPASVVHNWLDEAARFVPKLRAVVLSSGRDRHEILARTDVDLFVTNYALLRRDAEHWKDVELGALILDESQNIKNPDAAVTRVVRALKARHRLALTGTPLENRTRDVWSIVECVSPGYFGARKRFEERFDRPDVTDGERRLLSARLRPMMLRRRKIDVAPDLPPRTEEALRCELTPEQRRLYLATLRASRRLVDDLSQEGQDGEKARIQILAALMKLRQICCHPGLIDPSLANAASSKFDLLMEVLEPLLEEGHKVLVFSQFARCIHLLAGELTSRRIRHFVLTGATQKRERVVAAFQDSEEPAVFLISLKAGGTGLNLTAASYVVLFDPWWNPAVEAQAIDRTHRIGQTRSVMAYRLVAADTIEEKILELQREKASLADAVVDDATFGRRLAKEDLAFLLEE
ncbi:MAG TPA: DEAD/DEAH box helicase [Candidatus Binatia bacterium]|nr:DEAD/DEAH box helicase [Candidatus Binatia bacterium]